MHSIGWFTLMAMPFVLGVLTFYFIWCWMVRRMSKVALQLGLKKSAVVVPGTLAALALLALAISYLSGMSLLPSLALAIGIELGVTWVIWLGCWLYSRRTAGRILLDCGAHPVKNLFFLNAAMFLVTGLSGMYGDLLGFVLGTSQRYWIASALLGITLAVGWIILALGRLQIRLKGIWSYWGLLKWDKIQYYRWEGQTGCTLILQPKTRLPLLSRGALPVPMKYKDSVAELLKQHCSTEA